MSAPEPIVISLELPVPADRAFDCFAPAFAAWWPVATHSLSRTASTRVKIRCEPYGAIDECGPDNQWHRWGTVQVYEPGRRLRFSWHPGREPDSAQWVEVVFEPAGAGCRVTLTHGGWEALGEIAPILRREYASGWQLVFGQRYAEYVRTCAATASTPSQ